MTLRGGNTPASRLRSPSIGSDEEFSPTLAALDGRTTSAWFGRYLEKDFGATIASPFDTGTPLIKTTAGATTRVLRSRIPRDSRIWEGRWPQLGRPALVGAQQNDIRERREKTNRKESVFQARVLCR